MKSKKIKNLKLNFEKITISRLKQAVVKGGALNADEAVDVVGTSGKQTERGETCNYTGCGCN